MSDTATLEAPTSTTSAAKPLPSAKESGLVGMKSAMDAAIKKAATDVEKPAAAETPTETPKADASMLEKIESPKAPDKKTTREDDIKALKTARDHHENEAKTLRNELEKVKSSYVPPERLTAAEQRANDLEAKLETSALERSPKFQRQYVEPKIALVDQAKELAKDVLGDDAAVERALNLTGKQRREYLDEAFADQSPSALAELAGLLTSIDTLERKKSSALTNWKTERDRMSEAERADAMREAQDERNEVLRAFDASRNEVAQKIPGYREIIGDDAHNEMVRAKFDKARALLTGDAPMKDQATAAYLAVECGEALKREAAKDEQIAKLTNRLRQFEGNDAKINGGDATHVTTDGKPMGMIERMRSLSQ